MNSDSRIVASISRTSGLGFSRQICGMFDVGRATLSRLIDLNHDLRKNKIYVFKRRAICLTAVWSRRTEDEGCACPQRTQDVVLQRHWLLLRMMRSELHSNFQCDCVIMNTVSPLFFGIWCSDSMSGIEVSLKHLQEVVVGAVKSDAQL